MAARPARTPVGGGPPRPGRRRVPSVPRPVRLVLLTVAGTVLILAVVWAVDVKVNGDRVARNVTVAGINVGDMEPDELAAVVNQIAQSYAESTVEIDSDGGRFEAGAPEFGLVVRQDRTVEAVLHVGRGGFAGKRMFDWARSFVSSRTAPVIITLDQRSVARVVATRDPGRTDPVEPSIAVEGDRMVVVEGKPGRGIPPDALARALAREAPEGVPLKVRVERSALPPRFSAEDATGLTERAEALAARGLPVSVGKAQAQVPASAIRKWLRAVPAGETLGLGVDGDSIAETLSELIPGTSTPPVNAGFTISGGQVVVTPSRPGTGCCAPEAAAVVQNALLNRSTVDDPVVLPVKSVPPSRTEDEARQLGIVEPLASFTTSHAAGEPRVHNIHLAADRIRGSVIEPGGTFSINRILGPRTSAKGYVEAPVIGEKSTFEKSVGGGISQLATTAFNAGFLAGVDIPEYMMHTLYISRYPYGREATLSYPSPDLKLRNNSGKGILVWTSYSATSVTVTLYGTRFTEVSMSNQTKSERGPCTVVVTERTRRFLSDGHTSVDRFRGQYAPKEGVECPR